MSGRGGSWRPRGGGHRQEAQGCRLDRVAGGIRLRLLGLPKPASWGEAKENGRLSDGLQDVLSGAAELLRVLHRGVEEMLETKTRWGEEAGKT